MGELGDIVEGRALQAKGKHYTLAELIGGPNAAEDAAQFAGGTFCTIYLAPYNYHRIHAPLGGGITGYVNMPGQLWPVNPIGLRNVEKLFCVNERLTTFLKTPRGACAVVAVGATNVGRIRAVYDDVVTKRMSAGACVPAITSAQAVGRAVRALGARRIAIVSPYSDAVNERAARYFKTKHGLDTIACEGFRATDAYAIGQLGPQHARDAFARIDRPEIEVFVVPGGNFPTMPSIAAWEQEFKKPVVTTNQASIWAMLHAFNSAERLPAFGRLLAGPPVAAS